MKRITLLALGLAIAGAAPILLAQTAQTAPGGAPAGRPAAGQPGHHPKLDANGDGIIDRAEAAKSPRFAQMFDKFDANHDGKLSADERPQHRGRGGDMLAKLDANGDGAVDRAEAAKAPRLAEHFDKLDANHDGRISADERPQRGHHGGGDRGQRMAQLDKNGDGKFSRDELAGHERVLSHFADIDANKDGFVTRDEMKAYHQAHRGERGPRGPQGAAPKP
jgi:Ca2+-binding EF-hand superfamily protein